MLVSLSCRHLRGKKLARHVRAQARRTLVWMRLNNRSLSISLVGDAEIRQLNHSYRSRKRATDVLAFPLDEGPFGSLAHGMLGDVVISVETAARQARRAHRSVTEMVDRLLVHGILHLAGYDHEGSLDEARRMRKQERELGQVMARFRVGSGGVRRNRRVGSGESRGRR